MYAPSPTAAAGDGVDLHIINNPVCASIAYALDKKPSEDEERNVMVYNHGGDDLSVAVLTVEEGGVFSMRSAARETQLAGDEFTNRLLNHFAAEFSRKHNKDLSTAAASLRRLREACERVKRALSSKTKTTIEINSLYEGIDFYGSITRGIRVPHYGFAPKKSGRSQKVFGTRPYFRRTTSCRNSSCRRNLENTEAAETIGGFSRQLNMQIRLFHGSRVPMDTNNSSKITERNWRIPVAPQGTARVKLRIEIDYLTLSVFIMDNLIFKTTNLCTYYFYMAQFYWLVMVREVQPSRTLDNPY
ncbi:hypothetical protein MIMGU_mgv11b023464mg [Erythranthe guttata]|uniref:Uncharacterized protein n=1 Tax=Erythranthe guttata TaxID=4155 RepID=A0A022Q3T5_ERYGU|nr:hypothetical protein MIMGU_mgv11b023464mg [Erythranthe guttata]